MQTGFEISLFLIDSMQAYFIGWQTMDSNKFWQYDMVFVEENIFKSYHNYINYINILIIEIILNIVTIQNVELRPFTMLLYYIILNP